MICVHIPEIGDTFFSRNNHKGILGMEYTKKDMHLIVDGVTSNIIVNRHAIPF